MRRILRMSASIIVGLSFLLGEYWAVRAFFQVELCSGSDCRWALSGWHPAWVGALFVFVYLPLSPVVSLLYAWPGYLVGGLLFWIGGWRERAGTKV